MQKGRPGLFLILFLALVSAGWLGSCSGNQPTELSQRLKQHVRYLASDRLEGRASGTEGARLAAQYLKEQFQQIGLQPVAGQYSQSFSIVTDVELGPRNSAQILLPASRQGGKDTLHWQIGQDYLPLAFSVDTLLEAPVVFGGFGMVDTESEYNDFQGLDVKGKFVLLLKGMPSWVDPHSGFSARSSMRFKASAARDAGAVGVIFVSPDSLDDELSPLRPDHTGSQSGIAVVEATAKAVRYFLPPGFTPFRLAEKIEQTRQPLHMAPTGARLRLAVDLERVHQSTENVFGLVPGTDPELRSEVLVVGAHYDHLGWGGGSNSRYEGEKPAIHHGADDNASGTAAVIELARYFSRHPQPRSLLFVAFTGEEIGLLGSSHFVQDPPVPLEQIVAMFNLDMVGRMEENQLHVQGVGTSSLWEPLVDSLANQYQLKVRKGKDGYGPSDHASFYSKKLPVLFFFTGLHDDYHRPSDTWEKLNYTGLATVVQFTRDLIEEVARRPKRPDFVQVQSDSPGRAAAFRVYMGTIPDYADHPLGLRISGVRQGSPAQKAGLQGGDIIVEFAGTPIKNIYDYTYALSRCRPGQQVEVTVLRGQKQKLVLTVTLEGRKSR